LIFPPGQQERIDIHESTSAVDILPTLMQVAGKGAEIPGWAEGRPLPPFGPPQPSREVFPLEADGTEQNAPMDFGSVQMIRHPYKLHYYFGYPRLKGAERIELYNLEDDPGEVEDLAGVQPELAAELLQVLKARVAQVLKARLAEEDLPFR
jgi:arylsulfatase A-like enzyme